MFDGLDSHIRDCLREVDDCVGYCSKALEKEDVNASVSLSSLLSSPDVCPMRKSCFHYISANHDLQPSDTMVLIQIDATWDSQTRRSVVAWVVFYN